MLYKTILGQLATKENKSKRQIEQEMEQAIKEAGLNCTVKEFIKITSFFINQRRYIA